VWKEKYLCSKWEGVLPFLPVVTNPQPPDDDDKTVQAYLKTCLLTSGALNLWSIMHLEGLIYTATRITRVPVRLSGYGGSTFLRNVGIYLQVQTALQPRPGTSTSFTAVMKPSTERKTR
jgi:hypothetical protein